MADEKKLGSAAPEVTKTEAPPPGDKHSKTEAPPPGDELVPSTAEAPPHKDKHSETEAPPGDKLVPSTAEAPPPGDKHSKTEAPPPGENLVISTTEAPPADTPDGGGHHGGGGGGRERRLGAPGMIASHQSAGYHNATAYPFVGVALLAVLYAYKKAKTATKVSVAAEEDLE